MKKIIILIIVLIPLQLFAQFGKNKVQYEEFNWKYIQSSHFDIYYDEGSKYLAEYAAVTAERALVDINKLLNYMPEGRIALIVYNSHNEFQQTNVVGSYLSEGVGGATEMMKNRIILPFQGDYKIFNHVIRHEMIHSILNFLFYGGTYKTAITVGMDLEFPLWMNEGLAEYTSRGGMDNETDMYMRDLAMLGDIPSLERLYGYMAYRGGQTFYWYVAQKYGEEKIGDLLSALMSLRALDKAFEAVFRKNVEDFSEEWQADIKKRYWPDLKKFADPKDYSMRLTNQKKDHTYYNSSPAISPDGEKMAYISAPDGIFAIYTKKIDAKEPGKKLISSMRRSDFEDLNMLTPGISWNPDGTKLAVSAKSGGEDAVFIVEEKTRDYIKLVWGLKSIASVHWSPDGKKLAFIASKDNCSDLYVYDFETKDLINLTEDIFSDRDPVWASNSKTIYFISDRTIFTSQTLIPNKFKMYDYDVYQSDIYKIDIETSSIERITNTPEEFKTSLAIGSEENKIIYVSDKNGIGNLYEFDLTNQNSRPLTNSITGITQISLSKDGSKLLFTAQTNGGFDIFLLRHPFGMKQDSSELPVTELISSKIKKEELKNQITEIEQSPQKEDKLEGYGDFDVDLTSQKAIKPNPRAKVPTNQVNQGLVVAPAESLIDGEFIENDYKIIFSPDFISGNPGYNTYYGAQGIAQMLFSDKMGDHQIYIQANLITDIKNSTLMFSYNYLPKLIDWQFSGYHIAGFVRGLTPSKENINYYRYRNIGLGTTAVYPVSLFQRYEAGADVMLLTKENVYNAQYEASTYKFLFVPRAKMVFDNTLWSNFGPVRGLRYYVELKASPVISGYGVGFASVGTDARFYQPIVRDLTLALRASAKASFGPNPQNFFLGGLDNWINSKFKDDMLPFDQPEDFAFMEFQTPLRGWAVAETFGSKFLMANIELRYPFLTALFAGDTPFFVSGIEAVVFSDIGTAFNNKLTFSHYDEYGLEIQDLLMSAGFGLRAYLFGIPVKFDIAWRREISKWSSPVYLWSLGYDF
jgi:Tol biopolymer transport system component